MNGRLNEADVAGYLALSKKLFKTALGVCLGVYAILVGPDLVDQYLLSTVVYDTKADPVISVGLHLRETLGPILALAYVALGCVRVYEHITEYLGEPNEQLFNS